MIVSNTYPLIHLGKADKLPPLKECFTAVLIPQSVYDEIVKYPQSTEAMSLKAAVDQRCVCVVSGEAEENQIRQASSIALSKSPVGTVPCPLKLPLILYPAESAQAQFVWIPIEQPFIPEWVLLVWVFPEVRESISQHYIQGNEPFFTEMNIHLLQYPFKYADLHIEMIRFSIDSGTVVIDIVVDSPLLNNIWPAQMQIQPLLYLWIALLNAVKIDFPSTKTACASHAQLPPPLNKLFTAARSNASRAFTIGMPLSCGEMSNGRSVQPRIIPSAPALCSFRMILLILPLSSLLVLLWIILMMQPLIHACSRASGATTPIWRFASSLVNSPSCMVLVDANTPAFPSLSLLHVSAVSSMMLSIGTGEIFRSCRMKVWTVLQGMATCVQPALLSLATDCSSKLRCSCDAPPVISRRSAAREMGRLSITRWGCPCTCCMNIRLTSMQNMALVSGPSPPMMPSMLCFIAYTCRLPVAAFRRAALALSAPQ